MKVLALTIVSLFLLWPARTFADRCVEGQRLADDCKDLRNTGLFGCCSGRLSVWCEHSEKTGTDALCYLDCARNQNPMAAKCGWNPHFGFYGCFDGGPDPSGQHPMACPACEPQCEGKECGYDGCYGLCGRCPSGEYCDNGKCKTCSCSGLQCGPDQCGHPCGTCTNGMYCKHGTCVMPSTVPYYCSTHLIGGSKDADLDRCVCNKVGDWPCCRLRWNEQCIQEAERYCDIECPCLPDCKGKQCGPDGCGGKCGTCPDNAPFCHDGTCVPCMDCSKLECGSNGCGVPCGTCTGHKACIRGKCELPHAWCQEKDVPGCSTPFEDCDQNIVDCVCQSKNDHYCCDTKWDWLCVSEYLDCARKVFDKFLTCPCTPHCEGRQCGDDGCGGSCGECGAGMECDQAGMCVHPTAVCGNGTCEQDEDCDTCPVDCGCGDGMVCVNGACTTPGASDNDPDAGLDTMAPDDGGATGDINDIDTITDTDPGIDTARDVSDVPYTDNHGLPGSDIDAVKPPKDEVQEARYDIKSDDIPSHTPDTICLDPGKPHVDSVVDSRLHDTSHFDTVHGTDLQKNVSSSGGCATSRRGNQAILGIILLMLFVLGVSGLFSEH